MLTVPDDLAAGRAQARGGGCDLGAYLMLLRPGKLPPRCLPGVAVATSVPARCCCVPGSYRLGAFLVLL